jgi:transglutaminase/protease-like cytokinesis protein 3
MKYWICAILLFYNFAAQAKVDNDNFLKVDSLARLVKAKQVDVLVKELTAKYTDETLKARAIFVWVTENIAYDANRVLKPMYITFSGKDTAAALEKVDAKIVASTFTERKAVCEGYARLFKKMCTKANLECVLVEGFARTMDNCKDGSQKISHLWNAVKINGQWQLMDATWGSGYVDNNGKYVKDFEDFYFMVNPEQLIYSHFPKQAAMQFLSEPFSEIAFNNKPLLHPNFFKKEIVGISPSQGLLQLEKVNTVLEITLSTKTQNPLLSITEYEAQANGNITIFSSPNIEMPLSLQDNSTDLKVLKKQFQLRKNTHQVNVFLRKDLIATYWIKR